MSQFKWKCQQSHTCKIYYGLMSMSQNGQRPFTCTHQQTGPSQPAFNLPRTQLATKLQLLGWLVFRPNPFSSHLRDSHPEGRLDSPGRPVPPPELSPAVSLQPPVPMVPLAPYQLFCHWRQPCWPLSLLLFNFSSCVLWPCNPAIRFRFWPPASLTKLYLTSRGISTTCLSSPTSVAGLPEQIHQSVSFLGFQRGSLSEPRPALPFGPISWSSPRCYDLLLQQSHEGVRQALSLSVGCTALLLLTMFLGIFLWARPKTSIAFLWHLIPQGVLHLKMPWLSNTDDLGNNIQYKMATFEVTMGVSFSTSDWIYTVESELEHHGDQVQRLQKKEQNSGEKGMTLIQLAYQRSRAS